MKTEVLAETSCDVCGTWEFECRDEQLLCVTCHLPATGIECVTADDSRQEREPATRHGTA